MARLFIGGRPLLNRYYDGALDELSLYTRPLSRTGWMVLSMTASAR